MHRCECMNGYMSIYVAYMYRCSILGYILVCLVACIILVGLISSMVHSFLIICAYVHVYLVTYCLCMFTFSCGQEYSDVVVVVMHEVMVCAIVKVIH